MKTIYLNLIAAVWLASLAQPAFALGVGNPAPTCTLTSLGDDQRFDLKERFQGKVLVVDFWASWCGPCAKSVPFLNGLQKEMAERGVEVVGVNVDEELEEAKAFLAKNPAHFTTGRDAQQTCAKDFAVQAMPSTYLVDRHGVVRHVQLGFKESESGQIRTLLNQLVGEK